MIVLSIVRYEVRDLDVNNKVQITQHNIQSKRFAVQTFFFGLINKQSAISRTKIRVFLSWNSLPKNNVNVQRISLSVSVSFKFHSVNGFFNLKEFSHQTAISFLHLSLQIKTDGVR